MEQNKWCKTWKGTPERTTCIYIHEVVRHVTRTSCLFPAVKALELRRSPAHHMHTHCSRFVRHSSSSFGHHSTAGLKSTPPIRWWRTTLVLVP